MIKLLKDDAIAESALEIARGKVESNKDFVYNQDIIEVYISLPHDLFDPEILKELLGLRDEEDAEKKARKINDYTTSGDIAEKIIESIFENNDTEPAIYLLERYLNDGLIEPDYFEKKHWKQVRNKKIFQLMRVNTRFLEPS